MGKTYVVFKGRNPGIYSTWEETELQFHKFRGVVHKSYRTREEALKAFTNYTERSHATFSPSTTTSSGTSSRGASSSNATSESKLGQLIDEQLKLAQKQRQHSLRVAELYEELEKKLRLIHLNDDAK